MPLRVTAPLPQKRKRQGRPPAVHEIEIRYFLLTAFFNSAPAVNLATLRAAILMVAPVCGLRPLRAFLWDTENVPNPINATRSPFFSAAVMLSTAVSMAAAACVLLMRLLAAIRSTRSALFIFSPGQVWFSVFRARGRVAPAKQKTWRTYLALQF